MGSNNKLLTGILVGALAGAAVSLLDKQTREDVVKTGNNISSKVKGYMQQPATFTNDVKKNIDVVKETVQEVSEDLSFMNDQIKEIKETTPQVVSIIQETRDRFFQK